MYCMSVASTIAKLTFSISSVTLRYGEDDMSHLYSCISMIRVQRFYSTLSVKVRLADLYLKKCSRIITQIGV